MAKQNINLGTAPTGAGGDDRRSAWLKAVSNFTELYDFLASTPNAASLPASLAAALDNVGGYRRANALGTVSQAGGVPTGALIEAGTNANGSYAKFADGTMICRGNSQGIDQTTTGQAYSANITMPAAFVGAFSVQCNIVSVNVSNVFSGYSRTAQVSASVFSIIQYWNVVQTYSYSWIAVGRWF